MISHSNNPSKTKSTSISGLKVRTNLKAGLTCRKAGGV